MGLQAVAKHSAGVCGLTRRQMQIGAFALVFIFLLGAALPVAAQSFWDELLAGFESTIGAAVAEDVQTEYGPPARLGAAHQRWVDTIFADIVLQANRRDITYSLQVLESEVVNAFAAPGGYIFLTTALLHHIGTDADALANVLGHEVAHVEHKHGMNALGRNLGVSLLLQLALGNPSEGDEVWHVVAGVAVGLMQLGWSRDQEYESDELGQRLAAAAGYDPRGMVRFFRVLEQLQGMEVAFLEFLSTHPLTSERIRRAENRAESLAVSPRNGPKPVLTPGQIGGAAPSPRPGAGSTGSRGQVVSRAPRPVAVGGAFTMDVPAGWSLVWERSPDQTRADSPKIAEFVESRGDGYVVAYEYGTGFFTTARDTAGEWLQVIMDQRPDAQLVESLRAKRVGDYDAASFLVTWSDGDRRWAQYVNTIVLNWTSWEFHFVYPADDFAGSRAAFDAWLHSWRPGG